MPVPTSAVTPNFGFSTAIPNMEKNVENEAKNLNKFGDSFKQPERSRRVSFERKSSQQESTPSSSEMEEVQKKKLRVPNPAVELMRLTANPSMHEKKKEDKGVKLEDHMIKKNGNQVEKEVNPNFLNICNYIAI